MVYKRKDNTYLDFIDVNTRKFIFIRRADTSTGYIQGFAYSSNQPGNDYVNQILAFDVIDSKTGQIIDKARP